MIEHDRDDDIYEIDCDYCSAHESIDAANGWQYMIEKLKKMGWSIRKIGEDWKHMCDTCRSEGKHW